MSAADLPERPWLVTGLAGYDPWAHLGEMEGVALTWHDEGPMGETDFDTTTVSLRRGLTSTERRSTLAHELVHIERGPVAGLGSVTHQVEEHIADMTAALRLIPNYVVEDLPELVERHGRGAAVDFLGVDDALLEVALGVVRAVRCERAS